MKKEPKLLVSMTLGCGALLAIVLMYNLRRQAPVQPMTPSSFPQKSKAAAEAPATFTRKAPTGADARQVLENFKAELSINGLQDEKAATAVLLDIIHDVPDSAVQAIQLLQEFESGQGLMSLYEFEGLRADLKISLIEASLDPADSSMKADLREKSKQLLESMFVSGSPADAFQAASALRLFPDLADVELEKMGQGLCRLKDQSENDELEALKYEALKLRLQRSVVNRQQIRKLLSGCEA